LLLPAGNSGPNLHGTIYCTISYLGLFEHQVNFLAFESETTKFDQCFSQSNCNYYSVIWPESTRRFTIYDTHQRIYTKVHSLAYDESEIGGSKGLAGVPFKCNVIRKARFDSFLRGPGGMKSHGVQESNDNF
jgi:hypothetical protein